MVSKDNLKPDYGQDVPEMVRDNFIIAIILLVQGVILNVWSRKGQSTFTPLVSLLGKVTLLIGGLCTFDGLAIIWSSRVAKLWERNLLIKRLQLRGNERVLDMGCGHGLLLVGVAKHLPRGRAVGVDLWSQTDQGKNSKAATLQNARLEGVEDRVEIHTADMRHLPFADNSFDVVVANLAIHNIEDAEGRAQAAREIKRVLKPGGKVDIVDMFFVQQLADNLRQAGIRNVRVSFPRFWNYYPTRTISGCK